MTAEKLFSILKFLDDLDKELGLQANLESVRDALSKLTGSPANPPFQSALASAMEAFSNSAKRLEVIAPTQATVIEQLGGRRYFDQSIADEVRDVIQKNAMTPSVPRDYVEDLAEKRAAFLATIRGALQNLAELGIKVSTVKTDSADVAFLIPRELFENHLGNFAKELGFISRFVGDVSEAVTGHAQPTELEELSSSIPTVTLLANVGVISLIGTVVNKFLEAWLKIEKIRRMRADMKEMGIEGAPIEVLTEQITTTVTEVIEESAEVIVAKFPGDSGRKNELANALRTDTQRLFGQIERGLRMEFRAATDGKGQNQAELQNISDLSKKLNFPEVAKEPILLENGKIIEGEIRLAKHTKKTTSLKTTTSKKETKETKPEEK
ncbi:MAG TPA: hypothetical protein VGI46_16730 [Candidatus Acidoferrum sp.]|jgi:hypothetical protein